MTTIPTLPDNEPVITPQGTPSLAGTGRDSISKVFNTFGKDALAISKHQELLNNYNKRLQDTAATYQALSTAGKLKTAAEIDIINNPGHAYKTAKSYIENINNIAQSTPTLNPDKLNYSLGSVGNSLAVQASKIQNNYNLNQLRKQFDNNLPQMLSNMTQAIAKGDRESFSVNRQSILDTLNSLQNSGAITNAAYKKYHQTIEHYDNSIAELSNLKHNDETSHIVAANPLLDVGVPHILGRNGNAIDAADKLNTTSSLNSLVSDLASGKQLNVASFINLNDDKQKLLIEYAKGAAIVNGKLNFGTDFQEMNERHDYLASLKSPTLMEQGEYQRLSNVLNRLNSGEFNSVIGQLPIGKQLQAELQSEATIPDGATNEEAEMIRAKARDNYLTKAGNLWRSQNGDPSFIRVGANSTYKLESALRNPEVSPLEAIKEISKYSSHNRIYLANSLKDPLLQTTTFMLSNLEERVPSSDRIDLINSVKNFKSNKEALNLNSINSKELRSSSIGFLSDNKNELDYLHTIGADDIRNSIVNLQHQYVVHKTLENYGTFSGGDKFNELLKKSFNIVKGPNYIFSLSAMPGITASQADIIANKTLHEAYYKIGRTYNKSNISNTLSSGTPLDALVKTATLAGNLAAKLSNYFTTSDIPIKVFNELNGDIKAIDKNGQVIVEHHLTDDYLRSVLNQS